MSNVPISVVVPAYNAQQTIGLALEGILAQSSSGDLEIIVVDDGSTDRTPEIVRSFPQVIYTRQPNAGPAAARNRGARQAQGEFIFFTDSDCIPDPGWIARILPHFDSDEIAAVAGSYGIANPGSRLARCIHEEILFRHQKLMPQFPKAFGSYNFAVRKKVFEAVGGFDTSYRFASGEDNDLSYKILKTGKIYFEREATVRHFHPTRLLKYLWEQYRHGFWRAKMYVQHPHMMKGDDYTFWKDILEVPLVLLSFLVCFLVLFCPGLSVTIPVFPVPFLVLFLLNFLFSLSAIRGLKNTFFFTGVMFVRAYFRTLGFSLGVFRFLPPKCLKKK